MGYWTAAMVMAAALAQPPPQITADQRAKFWRAQAEYLAATAQQQQARAALEAAQADLARACGKQAVAADAKGEPSCRLRLGK